MRRHGASALINSAPPWRSAGASKRAAVALPALRMGAVCGGGGGSHLGQQTASTYGHVQYTLAKHVAHAIPSRTPQDRLASSPTWVARGVSRSVSLPVLPESGRGRSARAGLTSGLNVRW